MAIWCIYKVAKKVVGLGFMEARDEREAIAQAAIQFKVGRE